MLIWGDQRLIIWAETRVSHQCIQALSNSEATDDNANDDYIWKIRIVDAGVLKKLHYPAQLSNCGRQLQITAC